MNEDGFTLVEIVAVLIILSIIVLVAFPNILNSITKTNEKMDEATKELLIANAKSYWNDNETFVDNNSYCVSVKTLLEENYTKESKGILSCRECEECIEKSGESKCSDKKECKDCKKSEYEWVVRANYVSSGKWNYEATAGKCS